MRRLCAAIAAATALAMLLPVGITLCVGEPTEARVLTGPGDRMLSVGVPGLQPQIETLNPLLAHSGPEFNVIWSCYDTLLTWDSDGDLMGDLATEWDLAPDYLTWRIKIVETASFYDRTVPGVQIPLTVNDVIFTYWLVQNSTGNGLQYYFPELPDTGGRVIESMIRITDHEMELRLRTQYAPFMSALTTVPILPQYIWSSQPWNWRNYGAGYPPCVGSGPWYYALNSEPDSGVVDLCRNPTWFGTEEYGWQLHVNRLVLRSETEDSNYMNYIAGVNSIMTGITPGQYNSGTLGGTKWQSSQGFVFEFNMNQLTEENRDLYNIGNPTDYNSQLLLDPVLKLALQMSIDKELLVAASLGGLGKPADSLMPETSPWRYDYGGPDAPPGEVEIPFDPGMARMMLYDNGWRYRLDGTEILNTAPDYWDYYPLSRLVGGVLSETLSLRFVTLDSDSFFVEGSMLIEQWAAQTGIDLDLIVETVAAMNSIWYTADYDTWFWDWVFDPAGDPSTEVMQVLTTEAIGRWSDVYWSNTTYDVLYDESLTAMSPPERRLILDEMQRMAYEHSGCWPVAWMDTLYAAQSVSPEYWQNWGNWTEDYELCVDSRHPWLFTRIYPADNPAPQITSWCALYEADTLIPVSFSATVVDSGLPATLEYRWNYGDGTKSAWQNSPDVTHSYSADGYYTAWMMVREVGTTDAFMTSKETLVRVLGDNSAPYDLNFTYEPADPDTGTIVCLNGTASDDEGDPLSFSWEFGDGRTATGQQVMHQFSFGAQAYTVTMYVDDGHLGIENRPVWTSRLVSVSPNSAPTIVVQDEPSVPWKVPFEFRVFASDPDSRDTLRYTWNWGDGSPLTVTSTKTAWHTYTQRLMYYLTVWCDDLTGLEGHNVSDTGVVRVAPPPNHAPVITSFSVSNETPTVGETATFYGTATDRDNDLLAFLWDFGDGTTAVSYQTMVNSTLVMEHVYTVAGPVLAYLAVSDGQTSVTTMDPIIVDVQPPSNVEPVVDPLPAVYTTVGVETEFVAVATDGDGDPLTYTWDFNDGSDLVVGNPVMHTYEAASGEFGMLYTVYVDDGQGHNVSANGLAYVEPGVDCGWLRAVTNPAVPGMVYVDGDWMSRWGLDWVKLDPGEYTLSFGDVLGFVTPAPQTVEIVAGEITYAEGVYVAMGSLRVITDPAVPSTICVDGVPRNDWGFWNYVPAGTYTVSFGAVADMATPSPQTVTVTEGGFQQVIGTFTSSPGAPGPDPATYGMLRVTTSPAVPTMVYLDGEWMSHWGLDWVKVAPGTHTLSFSDVFGAITPDPVVIEITAGMTTAYEAVFELAGTLRVMTSPPVPSTIYVDDIARNDWGLWVDVPVGTYIVSFGDVEGLTAPAAQEVTVTAGGYTEVTGIFT